MVDEDSADAYYQDWQQLGDLYFCKQDVYALDWGTDDTKQPSSGFKFEYMRTFAGAFGGPIASVRDEQKVVLHLGSLARPDVQIFSSSGQPIARILWDKGRIVAAGWTLHDDETLLIVDDGGNCYCYTPLGVLKGDQVAGSASTAIFSLGRECETEGLQDVVVFTTGVAALTTAGHLWCVDDLNDPRAHKYPNPNASATAATADAHCMAVIPASVSASGSVEVAVAVENTVILVDSATVTPSSIIEGPILKLAASPDGKYIAGFGADNIIHIWTADLADVVTRVGVWETSEDATEFLGVDAAPDEFPDSFTWCGSDGVLIFWEGTGVLLLTLEGNWRWFDTGSSGAATLVTEIDGARIITAHTSWWLYRVPATVASVMEVGATSPGALLYDARQLYEKRDPRAAPELLEVLHAGDLTGAVESCLQAASAELDPSKQEALMRASCYGRAFLLLQQQQQQIKNGSISMSEDSSRGNHIVEIARKLRVLNALRVPEVALPLTMHQFNHLGVAAVVARLVARRQYLLALRACEALEASTEEVLVHWACDKIAASASTLADDELVAALKAKLEGRSGIKWARVAAHAQSQGRRSLATALLELETCASDQVPLLLELGEDEQALNKAVASGDADLILKAAYTTWRRLDSQHNPGSTSQRRFWNIVKSSPSTAAILRNYFACQSDDMLETMLLAVGDHAALADSKLKAALDAAADSNFTESQRQKLLHAAKDEYLRAIPTAVPTDSRAAAVPVNRDFKSYSQNVLQLVRLRELQRDLEVASGREGFLGLSVIESIKQCLRLGLKDQAQTIGREFKVTEKQFMLLSISVYASQHDWAALQHMASKIDRKAPVNLEHFIAAAISNDAPVHTTRWFVDRMSGDTTTAVRKAQLYLELGLQREAAQLLEQSELQGAPAGVLGSLREAVSGGFVGSFLGRQA